MQLHFFLKQFFFLENVYTKRVTLFAVLHKIITNKKNLLDKQSFFENVSRTCLLNICQLWAFSQSMHTSYHWGMNQWKKKKCYCYNNYALNTLFWLFSVQSVSHEMCTMEGLHFSSTLNTANQVSCSAVRGVTIKIPKRETRVYNPTYWHGWWISVSQCWLLYGTGQMYIVWVSAAEWVIKHS